MYYLLRTIFGILLLLFAVCVQANVEKTIFLAPPAATVPSDEPDFDDLGLERLSPQSPIVRTYLNASFPTSEAPEGTDSWFFLENLTPGQRYEVRVCWLATQPTSFALTTHPLREAIENPALLSSLGVFSTARLAALDSRLQANAILRRSTPHSSGNVPGPARLTVDSILFLRVRAAADYFSKDDTLMRDVPPVAVDLILDPFLWNIFPRTLVPTAGWTAVVVVLAIGVAQWVSGEVRRVVDDARRARRDKKED